MYYRDDSHDREPHPHLHAPRRRRRDAPRRHEPRAQDAPADRGLRDRRRAQRAARRRARRAAACPTPYAAWLRRVQNDLFDVGADLSVPEGGDRERLRVVPEQTAWLEEALRRGQRRAAEPLKSFVLPGGTPAAAQLHVCRTVCRRAERRAIACGDAVNPECVRYLNRLSRPAVHPLPRRQRARGELLWSPGAGR